MCPGFIGFLKRDFSSLGVHASLVYSRVLFGIFCIWKARWANTSL